MSLRASIDETFNSLLDSRATLLLVTNDIIIFHTDISYGYSSSALLRLKLAMIYQYGCDYYDFNYKRSTV